LPGQFPDSFERAGNKRRRQDERVRRSLLAAQFGYCWRNRCFKKVRVRTSLGDYATQAIAMVYHTDCSFEGLAESPAQSGPQKIREIDLAGCSQAKLVTRNIQRGKLIRVHLTYLLL
jgi:hypothetical protein